MSIRLPSYKIARKGTTTCIILWGSFSLYWLLYYKCVVTNIYDLAPIWWPLWQTSDCCYVTAVFQHSGISCYKPIEVITISELHSCNRKTRWYNKFIFEKKIFIAFTFAQYKSINIPINYESLILVVHCIVICRSNY